MRNSVEEKYLQAFPVMQDSCICSMSTCTLPDQEGFDGINGQPRLINLVPYVPAVKIPVISVYSRLLKRCVTVCICLVRVYTMIKQ
jgi:hypothetical protein